MYYCTNCHKYFSETEELNTTYEAWFGSPLPTSTPLTLDVCPYCESDEIEDCGTLYKIGNNIMEEQEAIDYFEQFRDLKTDDGSYVINGVIYYDLDNVLEDYVWEED